MATLNKRASTIRTERIAQERTTNKAGATAYKMTPMESLIERTVGAFWSEDLFYAKGSSVAKDIVKDINEVAKTEPQFVLQLAAWARNDLYLRTTPQVLLVEAANIEACKPWVREYAPKIVKRADELAEVVAYQLNAHGKPIPNSLKKGLADAFANFDEYQLNKYDSSKNSVSLADVLHLVDRRAGYPVSKEMWNYLVNGEVDQRALPKTWALKQLLKRKDFDEDAKRLIRESGATWETVTSHFGSSKEVWESVIPNMGYMALLRNLRNFEQKNVDLEPVLKRIADPNQVKRSKQLPFRFYSAYKNTSNPDVNRAISKAFEASVSNVSLEGRTGVVVDLSGSMNAGLSNKSQMSYREVAAVMGAIVIRKANRSVVVGFANTAETIKLNPDDTMMTNIEKISKVNVGGATYANLGMKEIASHGEFDRIILISDMQCYSQTARHMTWYTNGVYDEWHKYSKQYPKARLYSLDVSAYGTKQLPSVDSRRATVINGWSDKIIDYISLSEKMNAMEWQIRKW